MRLFILLLLTITKFSSLSAQDALQSKKTLSCLKQFKRAGWDQERYSPNDPKVSLHLHPAEQQFRASQGLLIGGLASALIGSGAVLTGTLGSNESKALRPYSTPLILSGAALNIVVMPVCFVLRDVMIKKATKHVKAALALNPQTISKP